MELLRVGPAGDERPVVRESGTCYSLAPLLRGGDLDGAFLARNGIAEVRAALAARQLEAVDISGERLGAPIARPGAVICIGQNYAAHAAESGAAPPKVPIIFFKHPNTVVGPFDDVLIPRHSTKTDWEVELAVVIGRRCRYLASPRHAREHIAGCTISNDVSERAFQIEESGGQWSKGKCCETFNPLGPSLVPADEIEDFQSLGLRSFVNGEPRQHSSTADMIFGVEQLVFDLSQYLVLEPGDVINTGTPEGVALSGRFAYLRPGDTMRLEIDGLGHQEQRLVAAGEEATAL
jgi:2-keto-4-pentenoate hydratase/2-oxohepta-3-ene-1,7-dioic acid hydratase in catechol pathway